MLSEVPEGWSHPASLSIYASNETRKWNGVEALSYIGLEHIEQGTGRLLGFGESQSVTSAKNVFEPGDVLFGKLRPNLRKYWKADRRGICSTDILVLRGKQGLESDYLFAVVQSEPFLAFAENDAAGTKMPRTSWKRLETIELPIPPLNEQNRIAEILSSVDTSIQATQAVIEQAERVKRGLMEELLTGGLGSEAIERGEVPEGWELCQLADKSIFTNGKAHEKDIDENGEFIVVNSKFISSEGSVAKRTNSAMCLAAKNDILMVMSDVPKGKAIAKCFYVDKGDSYTVNQRICRLTAQEIEPLFLFYVLNRNRYFLAFDDGVKQTNLRKNEVLECPVGVPPVDYQRKVIEILEAFTTKIDLDYKQLNRLKIIKRGLMDDLLTGKVRTV